MPGEPVAYAHFKEGFGYVFPVVEHEVFQDVVFLFEVGENVEMIRADISAVGICRGQPSHPFQQIFFKPAARDVVVARVGIHGFAVCERSEHVFGACRFRRDFAVFRAEIERLDVFGYEIVFRFAYAHGNDVFGEFAVRAVT